MEAFQYTLDNKRYHTYNYYLHRRYGGKCVKIPLDGGFCCPNMDGSRGRGGCLYCPLPVRTHRIEPPEPLSVQYEKKRRQLAEKWGELPTIPYFQNYTGSYADCQTLRALYFEAASLPGAVAVSIATRPDALGEEKVTLLRELNETIPVTVELGLQTIHDSTAERIGRGHSYDEFLEAYHSLRGLDRCIHIIDFLPGESREMMLHTAREIARLRPELLKIHMLYVERGSALALLYEKRELTLPSLSEYAALVCDQIELLPPEICIARVTGDGESEALLAPAWSRKKFVCMNEIDKLLAARNGYQGKLFPSFS